MTHVPPPNPLAAQARRSFVTITDLTDPTAVGDTIQVVELDAVQLESRPFQARRVTVNLETLVLVFHSTNSAIRTRTRLSADFVAFSVFGPSARGSLNGLLVGPDLVFAGGPGVEVEFAVSAGYESVALLLPCTDLQRELRNRHRPNKCPLPRSSQLFQPADAAARGLYKFSRRLVDLAVRQPEVFDLHQTRTIAQAELLDFLLAALESVEQAQSTPQDRSRLSYSRVVQIAEDYVLARAGDDFTLGDLCKAAGVSERTLQYAFRELMGMTPMAYLNRLRLHRVRKALRCASHHSTTVSREALRWGFWHFGDFSRAYKECFGELPSETLRRPVNPVNDVCDSVPNLCPRSEV